MKPRRTARTPRFFHEGELQPNSELELSKKASHHLITVVRTKLDDSIELFNGDGFNYRAIVTDTGQRNAGKRAILQVEQRAKATTESPVFITLVQAISRGDRMDTSLRQSVELGVNRIQPLYSRQSAKALDDKRTAKKMEHWQNIIISACEQSGRACVPHLETPISLTQWLAEQSAENQEHLVDNVLNLILAPNAELTFAEHLNSRSPLSPHCSLLIGPESGFDEDEVDAAVSAGVRAVNFGARILRTETAGPASIAVVQSLWGDLGQVSV